MFYDPDDDIGGLEGAATFVAQVLCVKHLARQFFRWAISLELV